MKMEGDLGGLCTVAVPGLRDVFPHQQITWISFRPENISTALRATQRTCVLTTIKNLHLEPWGLVQTEELRKSKGEFGQRL